MARQRKERQVTAWPMSRAVSRSGLVGGSRVGAVVPAAAPHPLEKAGLWLNRRVHKARYAFLFLWLLDYPHAAFHPRLITLLYLALTIDRMLQDWWKD